MIFKHKIGEYLKHHKYTFLLIFVVIGCGAIAGSFGAFRTGMEEFTPIQGISYKDIIILSFTENLKYLMWLAVWGFSGAGFLVILYLLYSKGAAISVAVYALVASNPENAILTVLSLIPYIACTMMSVMLLAQGAIESSWEVTKFVLLGKNTRKGNKKISVVIIELVVAVLFALLGGVCEAFLKVNIA